MPILIANTAKMSEAEWLELRRQGIGGSDCAAIAGVSKYSSPIMVYMDKLGMYQSDKPERVKEAAHFGHMLEPVVREEFKRRINVEREEQGLPPLRIVHRKALYAHDKYDFMRTNLDGIVYDGKRKGVFEAKTAHYMLRDEWEGDDVPNAYLMQCLHNMAVMEYDFAYLAVLIGGNTFKYYYIERDQEFIDYLIAIEEKFWNEHILKRIPPAFTGHAEEKNMLNEQYPDSENREGYIVTLPNSIIKIAEQVDAYKQVIKVLDENKNALENEIKATMGTTETAFAGSHKITWKTASNGVKTLRIKLDSQDERNKFYDRLMKNVEKEIKGLAKERTEIEKAAERQRKADEKARKEAEKLLKAQLKAEKAALKAAKENEKIEVTEVLA